MKLLLLSLITAAIFTSGCTVYFDETPQPYYRGPVVIPVIRPQPIIIVDPVYRYHYYPHYRHCR
jgi:hypothetical protein